MVCFDAAVGSVWLWAACLLMGGTVPVLLVLWPEALRLRTSRLLGGGRSWCQNGDLWGSSCQSIFSGASSTSVLALTVSYSQTPPPRPLVSFSPGSRGGTALCWFPVHVRPCVQPPREKSASPSPVELLRAGPDGLQSQIL